MKNNKVISFLLALVMAFGLWVYVTTVVNPEWENTYRNVAVTLSGESVLEENGLMLIMEEDLTVSVKLSGNRSDLNKINSNNLTITADLSKIKEPGTHQLSFSVVPPTDVPAGSVAVEDRDPQYVTVTVAERVTKEIPVEIVYSGTMPEDYIMDEPQMDYSYVTISGPREVVDQIDHASIAVDRTGMKETFVENMRYYLCGADGNPVDVEMVETNVEEIRLEIKVSKIKEVELVLTVNDGGGATSETSLIEINPKTIIISGSEAMLEKIDQINLGTINLSDVTNPVSYETEITLPEGVKNESATPRASISISFPELAKKDFTVVTITPVNVAEGMEASVVTKQLTITVRGPKDQIQQLQLEDIIVQVDVNEVVNTAAVEPEITFSEEFPDVGVVGKYSVSVTVKAKGNAG